MTAGTGYKKSTRAGRIVLYAFVTLTSVILLYPYLVMLVTSFTDLDQIYQIPPKMWPEVWKWRNYIDVWSAIPLAQFFSNTLVVSVVSTLLCIFCAVPAAYALTRMRFRGRSFFMRLIVVSQMFTAVVLLIGIYKVCVFFNIQDRLLSLILVNAAFNQAFAVWILRGTFVTIPRDLEQSAMIDGCNSVSAMIRIILPLAAPGIVTALIFVFISAWNEYPIALTLIGSTMRKTLTVGMRAFYGYTFIQWWYLFAVSLMATVPVIILFTIIEKHLVGGLTAGGVKA